MLPPISEYGGLREFNKITVLVVLSFRYLSQRLTIDSFILSWRPPRLEFEISSSVAPRSFSGVGALSQRSIGDAFILSLCSGELEFKLSIAPRPFSGARALSQRSVGDAFILSLLWRVRVTSMRFRSWYTAMTHGDRPHVRYQ